MTHTSVARMSAAHGKWSTVCAVVLCCAALLTAAPASADETGDAFVAALGRGGITTTDRNGAIAMANTVCGGLDANQSASVLAIKLVRDTDLSPRQAGYFIGLSVASYCPEYKGGLDTSVTWLSPGPPLM